MGSMLTETKKRKALDRFAEEHPGWIKKALAAINRWGDTTSLQQAIGEALQEAWEMGRNGENPEPPVPKRLVRHAPTPQPIARILRHSPPVKPKRITRTR